MNDKERLEEMKKNATDYYDSITLNQKDFMWLIEQAERLHGTKHKLGYIDMYADCNRTVGNDSMKIHKLEQQNKRYREALEQILKEKLSVWGYHQIVRKALESDKKNENNS